ncbi:carbohydrate ABC transporter permease [Paenibacillus koleovorans]|uniref:carbohydrate ABC transporter permease n=1 Tax=Paenibacillus koleovorans TaxID=121608 RepID=UPI001FE8A4C2|nr:carbohydrate ABC transporter permease [Paenibacillus koleovorans]
MRGRRLDLFTIVNALLMLVLMFVTVYPFVYVLNVSLSSETYVLQNAVSFWPKGFTLKWYAQVVQDERIWTGYKNTVIYTTLGTFLSLALTSMAAFALSQRHMVMRKSIMLGFVFTILFSGGMIPSYMVVQALGLLDTVWAMVIPGVINTFNVLIFRTFFEGLPEELFDAGRVDGMNDLGIFLRLVVPLSKPVFAAIGLFVAVGIWNNFYSALIYLKSADMFPLQLILRDLVISGTIASEAASQQQQGGDVVVADSLKYSTIIVSTLPILVLYPFLQKYFVKGVLLGSIKG